MHVESLTVALTGSVHRVVVEPELPEGQLHGSL